MVKKLGELVPHPVAALFPMLPDDELQELAESIKARGLEHPIVLDSEGRILDGRNRYAACRLAGIEPQFVTYEGEDADGYALDTNIHRRHMRPGARHLVTKMARRRASGGFPPPSKKAIASQAGIDRSDLNNAAAVLDFAPDLVPDVLAGRMGLQAAADVAREKLRAQKEREAKSARLKAGAPDLHELVEEGRLGIDDAIVALDSRESAAEAEIRQMRAKLLSSVQSGHRYASDVDTAFAASVMAIVTGSRDTFSAIELSPDDQDIKRPLITETKIKRIEEALALLKQEYGYE